MSFKQFLKESLIDKAIEKDSNLSEAVFSEKNLAKVMKLYSRLFSKQFESKFYLIGEENFKRASGKGVGARFINEQGYQLRFNWSREELRDLKKLDQKEGKGEALYLSSIDYWEPVNDDFGRPSTTLTFHKTLNVVQIWDKVSKLLKKGVKGKFTISDILGKDVVNEATPYELKNAQNREFAKRAGFTGVKFHSLTKDTLNQYLKDDPELQAKFDEYVLEITAGKQETNDLDTDLKKTKKDFDDKIYADPDLVFEDIERMVEFIAKKGSKSFICCGLGGVGKTYHITKTLEGMFGEAGLEWHYHSGMKITPFTIYKTVFQERNATIVFDEADDILTNSDIVVQLKPVLDTSGKNTMEYAHGTMSMIGKSEAEVREYCKEVDLKLAEGKFLGINNKGDSVQAPSKFYFDGQMIFISNMRANKIDQAIMSRSLFIDVYLCATDINKRIQSIMKAKYKDMSNEELEEIMESLGQSIPRVQSQETVTYMTPELARANKPVTVRSMELAVRMKKLGIPNWTRLASLYA